MSNYRLVAVITVTILLAISILSLYTPISEAQSSPIKIKWRVYSSAGNMDSYAYSVCETGNYIYVVGEQGGWTLYTRVEMRSKQDGSLAKVWISGGPVKTYGFYTAYDCAIAEGKLYFVIPGFNILVFDLNLNMLNYIHREINGQPNSIIYYANHLYIVGVEYKESGDSWLRVEKWNAKDLKIIKEYTSNPTPVFDFAMNVGINPVTEQLWIVANVNFGETSGILSVEILDLDLSLVKVIRNDHIGDPSYITFDEEGYAYISGIGMVKYDKYGEEVAIKDFPHSNLLYANGYLYLATHYVEYGTHYLFVFDKKLNLVDRIVLSENGTHARFTHGKMAFDGKNLYIAGYGKRKYDDLYWKWVIYSISILPEEAEMTTQTTETISPPITLTNATQATTIETPAVTLNITKPSTPSKDDMTTLTLIVIVFAIAVITVATAVMLAIRK
jgi:hypothetical protein